jgi:hypothetical protein
MNWKGENPSPTVWRAHPKDGWLLSVCKDATDGGEAWIWTAAYAVGTTSASMVGRRSLLDEAKNCVTEAYECLSLALREFEYHTSLPDPPDSQHF